jgi:hypothetical protein
MPRLLRLYGSHKDSRGAHLINRILIDIYQIDA